MSTRSTASPAKRRRGWAIATRESPALAPAPTGVVRRDTDTTEFAVKPPTVPIPFHKLLKVVALVDRDEPRRDSSSTTSPPSTSRSR